MFILLEVGVRRGFRCWKVSLFYCLWERLTDRDCRLLYVGGESCQCDCWERRIMGRDDFLNWVREKWNRMLLDIISTSSHFSCGEKRIKDTIITKIDSSPTPVPHSSKETRNPGHIEIIPIALHRR